MHEADIRAIVAETLAEQQRLNSGNIDAVVLKSIATILTSFGIEEEDRKELRADFQHLRRWRKSVEQAQIGAANIIESSVEDGHLVLPGGRQPIRSDVNLALAVAMIRPETIHVVEPGSASLSGIVSSVSFVGDRQRLVVNGTSDKPLTVDAPNTVQVRPGEQIGLLVAPESVRLLPLED
jgi:hypothetical protein